MLILGIDDAGRGPVIGPMILAGCLIDSGIEPELKSLGVKDSKQLTAEKRELIVEHIKKLALKFHISITTPIEIDEKTSKGINLNKLEAIKSAEIINALNSKEEKIKVIIDCPSPNTLAWRRLVLSYILHKENLEVFCEHKADINHISCSAASIIAKTTRDAEIEKIKKQIGIDFGSGYASDSVTIDFLNKNFHKFNHAGIFRKSWDTWRSAKARIEQKNIF